MVTTSDSDADPNASASESAPRVRELTDPRDLRALSHPLRMQVIELLGRRGSMTATELGEALGESSALMSYHLRQLARYGFVEEATSDAVGRQRPWRRAHRGMSWSTSRPDIPGYDVAARELMYVAFDRYIARIQRYLNVEPALPAEWRHAAAVGDNTIHVTADELEAISTAIRQVLEPYERDDPAERPAGARTVTYMLFGLPEFEDPAFDDGSS